MRSLAGGRRFFLGGRGTTNRGMGFICAENLIWQLPIMGDDHSVLQKISNASGRAGQTRFRLMPACPLNTPADSQ
jgi:hypothetical protein